VPCVARRKSPSSDARLKQLLVKIYEKGYPDRIGRIETIPKKIVSVRLS